MCKNVYCFFDNFEVVVLDIQECATDPNLCRNAECVNTPGSFRCECRDPNHTLDSTGRVCIGL